MADFPKPSGKKEEDKPEVTSFDMFVKDVRKGNGMPSPSAISNPTTSMPTPSAMPAPASAPSQMPKVTTLDSSDSSMFSTASKPSPKTPSAFDDGDSVDVISRTISDDDSITLDDLLKYTVEHKATDLHLTANTPPVYRHLGEVKPVPGYPPLSAQQVRDVIYGILSPAARTAFEEDLELNISYGIRNFGRFRVNVYMQRGTVACAIRLIPSKMPSIAELGLPRVLETFADFPRGLVLITGPTGSGKSTTLAAIIDKINRTKKKHILTIEDPVEFVHANKQCIINQREVGNDTQNFNEALRNALRQDPDVILLGEMRDLETIRSALTAAETGHLVFATLHTQSVSETMARIIDVFPDGAKDQVRAQLAATIQGIACQSLIRRMDGSSMVAAVEVLKANPAIRALIRKGNDEQIMTIIETSKQMGMQSLDSHLIELVKSNTISVDAAFEKASLHDNIIRGLGGEVGVEKTRRQQSKLGGVEVKQ